MALWLKVLLATLFMSLIVAVITLSVLYSNNLSKSLPCDTAVDERTSIISRDRIGYHMSTLFVVDIDGGPLVVQEFLEHVRVNAENATVVLIERPTHESLVMGEMVNRYINEGLVAKHIVSNGPLGLVEHRHFLDDFRDMAYTVRLTQLMHITPIVQLLDELDIFHDGTMYVYMAAPTSVYFSMMENAYLHGRTLQEQIHQYGRSKPQSSQVILFEHNRTARDAVPKHEAVAYAVNEIMVIQHLTMEPKRIIPEKDQITYKDLKLDPVTFDNRVEYLVETQPDQYVQHPTTSPADTELLEYHSLTKPLLVRGPTEGLEQILFKHQGQVIVENETSMSEQYGWITESVQQKHTQVIHVHVLCWNESHIIPLFLKHYDWVEIIFVYVDDSSTDCSVKLLEQNPKVRIQYFHADTPSEVGDIAHELRMHEWKHLSRGRADWVLVCDMDEFWYHPHFSEYLSQCVEDDVTILQPIGYEMVSYASPSVDRGPIHLQLKHGFRSEKWHSKPSMFRPDCIDEINFSRGCHAAVPSGNVRFNKKTDALKLMHLKYAFYIDVECAKNARLRKRYEETKRFYNVDETAYGRRKEMLLAMSYNVFNKTGNVFQ